jgi:hypothetical protein
MEIIPRREAIARGLLKHYSGKPCRAGHHALRWTNNGTCCVCEVLKKKSPEGKSKTNARDRARRKFETAERRAARLANHSKYNADYRARMGVEAVKARRTAWYAKSKESDPQFTKKLLANCRAYQTRKKRAMPAWVDAGALKTIYINCPAGCEVDHIVPLAGRNVCGLHVPWNLQYLPAAENRRKRNSFI